MPMLWRIASMSHSLSVTSNALTMILPDGGETERVDQRGVLDQQDDLVGQRWDDDPKGLGQDDREHGASRRHAEGASGLHLALGNRLHTGADRLRHVGRSD